MGDPVKCQRPGCGGTIVDGICEECGRPPVGASILNAREQHQPPAQTSVTNSFTGTTGTARSGSKRISSRSSQSSRVSSSRRHALGGGLVSLPPQPSEDPLKLVMENPEVPDRKRHCPACDAKVNRPKGFCPACGHEYNFIPALKAGDVLNEKFEIKGPVAFGGLGWIYLAYDDVLSRWVVLKGLLNTKDEAAAAAAVAERQFLAAVKHPKIVGIYDFIHRGAEGYIVMEYVGGKTIATILKEKGVLPVEEAIAYILGILPAFSYLHAHGMVYCDFKPENCMLENDDVKLIDMGGVRRIDDPSGDIYGTVGYMAPEASDNPVEVSDLYTIGRTLAVLIMNFKYQTTYEKSLPLPSEQPVLAQNEALYRFLLRATHIDPDQRFQSADEMADQLYGVLREIVALKSTPKPAESTVFTSDNLLDPADEHGASMVDVKYLPALKIDATDAAANEILRSAGIIDPKKRITPLQQMAAKFGDKSVEAKLRLAEAYIETEEFKAATKILDAVAADDGFDWRVSWYRGKLALTSGDGKTAGAEFDKVYFEMPGEVAPKLAIAYAAEEAGDNATAAKFYERVAKTDPDQTTACFGLARCLKNTGDAAGAAIALSMIPSNHSLYSLAHIETARVLLHNEAGLNDVIIDQAAKAIEAISAEGGIVHQLTAQLLRSAINLILAGKYPEDASKQILGHKLQVAQLRLGAEGEYRKASRFAATAEEKIKLVDLANRIRPRTVL